MRESALPLREPEIRLCGLVLSPSYVVRAAEALGAGDAMLGVPAAYAEVRRMVRTLVRAVIVREERHLAAMPAEAAAAERKRIRSEVRRLYEALGFMWRFQRVVPLEVPRWRSEIAFACWDRPEPISDLRTVPLPGALEPLKREGAAMVRHAVVRALSEAISNHPQINRAILPARGPRPRVWGRLTPEIMVHVGLGPDRVRPIVLDPTGLDHRELGRQLMRRYRRVLEIVKHPLAPVGDQILAEWCQHGFLASPAAAMVSDVSGLWEDDAGRPCGNDQPSAPLNGANGVPIAVAIGTIRPGAVPIRVTFDHRALDADPARFSHPYLGRRVPELLEEWLA